MEKITEIRNDFIDDDNLQHIDCWFGDNEEGKTVAVVDLDTNKVIFFDNGLRGDKEVRNAIEEILKSNIKPEFLQLAIDNESVSIYQDNGDMFDITPIVYWHIEEIEEDASVFPSIANAIDLFHTDKEKLLKTLGY